MIAGDVVWIHADDLTHCSPGKGCKRQHIAKPATEVRPKCQGARGTCSFQVMPGSKYCSGHQAPSVSAAR